MGRHLFIGLMTDQIIFAYRHDFNRAKTDACVVSIITEKTMNADITF